MWRTKGQNNNFPDVVWEEVGYRDDLQYIELLIFSRCLSFGLFVRHISRCEINFIHAKHNEKISSSFCLVKVLVANRIAKVLNTWGAQEKWPSSPAWSPQPPFWCPHTRVSTVTNYSRKVSINWIVYSKPNSKISPRWVLNIVKNRKSIIFRLFARNYWF